MRTSSPGVTNSVTSASNGRVATLVADDLVVADPDGGAVRGRLEVEDDALVGPAARHVDGALVPDVAEVVADRGVGGQVVEAGRHGHVARGGQGVAEPPGVAPGGVTVELERPDAVEALGLAGGGVLGAQHGGAFRDRWGVAPLSHRTRVRRERLPPVATSTPSRSREQSVRPPPNRESNSSVSRARMPSAHSRSREQSVGGVVSSSWARSRRARISASSSIRALKNRGWIAVRSRRRPGWPSFSATLQHQGPLGPCRC